ncbi:MAG TPA: sugar ABC transporter permease [Anaerolineaceae bacterium]|nr:sugar ABC transporter permease [Anaerolineaceae bacterium]HPD62667.1 sugar ABC transporter permease [Anaerolineaceae bacterium]HQF69312.1 sugar ABC transporter permease [Anaerolineaceae bacterium]HRT91412.1 sugar ABC transporter permease [Anaerolineaceae bacterium]HUM63352.1 sugar ABC transporter permease [Anaerolineaceae bacterium]
MKSQRRWPGESRFHGWLYLFPGLLIYLVFVFYPIIETFRTSFYKWDGFSRERVFVDFQNYISLVTDAQFLKALLNNLVFIIFYSIIPILLGLLLASLLGRKPLPGMTFFRTGLFLPQILSMVVVGVTWRWIFNPNFGLLNVGLRAIGLGAFTRAWLGDFQLALPSVGAVGTWVQYGFCMVLFLAGMQRIPNDQYEAAELDGANEFRQLLHITLPSLRAELGVALITTIIAALRVFDLVYVTTRGGPGDSTLVTGFLVYRSAFQQNQLGYASTVATVMTLLIFGISLIILRFQSRDGEGV